MITWTHSERLPWAQVLTRLARSRRLTQAEQDACAEVVDRILALVSERENLVPHVFYKRMYDSHVAKTAECNDLRAQLTASQESLKEQLAARALDAITPNQRAVAELLKRADDWVDDCKCNCVHCNRVLFGVDDLRNSAPDKAVPIHPAVMRVIEAARAWDNLCGKSRPRLNPIAEELGAALDALPSPLPRVVTCGECEFEADCEYHKCFSCTCGPKWCSDGKRGEDS